jgi:hypothetical protein
MSFRSHFKVFKFLSRRTTSPLPFFRPNDSSRNPAIPNLATDSPIHFVNWPKDVRFIIYSFLELPDLNKIALQNKALNKEICDIPLARLAPNIKKEFSTYTYKDARQIVLDYLEKKSGLEDEMEYHEKMILTVEAPCKFLCISVLPLITTGALAVGLSFSDLDTKLTICLSLCCCLSCCTMNTLIFKLTTLNSEGLFGDYHSDEIERLEESIDILEINKPKFLMFFNRESISNIEANPAFNSKDIEADTFDSKQP